MNEIWKDVVGYEGKYKVSNLGRVKSLNYRGKYGEHLLKLQSVRHGYLQVPLYKDKKIKFFMFIDWLQLLSSKTRKT